MSSAMHKYPLSKRAAAKFRKLWAAGLTYRQLVQKGFSRHTIRKAKIDLELPRRLQPFNVSKDRLRYLYYKYQSDWEVASFLGKSQFLVHYWRRKYHIPTIPYSRRNGVKRFRLFKIRHNGCHPVVIVREAERLSVRNLPPCKICNEPICAKDIEFIGSVYAVNRLAALVHIRNKGGVTGCIISNN